MLFALSCGRANRFDNIFKSLRRIIGDSRCRVHGVEKKRNPAHACQKQRRSVRQGRRRHRRTVVKLVPLLPVSGTHKQLIKFPYGTVAILPLTTYCALPCCCLVHLPHLPAYLHHYLDCLPKISVGMNTERSDTNLPVGVPRMGTSALSQLFRDQFARDWTMKRQSGPIFSRTVV